MPSFHYSGNSFFCEEVPLREVAERFGTPTYVYSQGVILENFRRIESGLRSVSALVCYSVKANSNLKILDLLRQAGAGFDIVSGGELLRVLQSRRDAGPHRLFGSGQDASRNRRRA